MQTALTLLASTLLALALRPRTLFASRAVTLTFTVYAPCSDALLLRLGAAGALALRRLFALALLALLLGPSGALPPTASPLRGDITLTPAGSNATPLGRFTV